MSFPALLQRHGMWIAVAIYLVLVTATIFTLQPWCDEGYNAGTAMNLVNHGYLGVPSIEPVTYEARPGLDRHWYWQVPFYPVALAGFFEVAGQGIYQMRFFTLLQGLLLLASLFVLLRRLTNAPWIAPLTVAILCMDYFYVRHSSDGRNDMLCASLGFSGLAAYMLLREHSGPLACLVGAAGVVGGAMSHAVGVIYPVELLYLVLRFDWRRVRWTWIVAAAVPALIAAGLWGRFIMEAPNDFRAQFFHETSDRAGFFKNPLDGMYREIMLRYVFTIGGIGRSAVVQPLRQIRVVLLIVYLAGMMISFFTRKLRQEWKIQPVIHMWAISSIMLLILDTGTRSLYLIHAMPWIAALLASAASWVWIQRPQQRWAVAATAAAFLAVQIGGLGFTIKRNEWENVFRPTARYLQQNVKPGETLIGGPEWGFVLGFGDHVLDDPCLGYFSKKTPTYIVLDPRYRDQITWYGAFQPPIYQFIQNRMQNQYRLVQQVESVEIYRIRTEFARN
jgi:hypothetical protein